MSFFDSALQFSILANDSLEIGNCYFAKGAVYDAWNKEKEKTIEYFEKAYNTLAPLSLNYPARKIYIHHLIAHAYEKKGDSVNTVKTINKTLELIDNAPDSIKAECDFIVQLALIATKVNDYHLSQRIFDHYLHYIDVKNDPNSYNYLDNYYLGQARRDIHQKQMKTSPFLDSFYNAYTRAKTPVDSIEMLAEIYPMYERTNNLGMAFSTLKTYFLLYKRLENAEGLLHAQQSLYNTETALKNAETQNLKKTNLIYILSIVLLFSILGGGIFYTSRMLKEQEKVKESLEANRLLSEELHEKNQHNELLNKEIQHRIKNNLQLIYSLFDMNERHIESAEAKSIIREAKNRVNSISFIFEQMKVNSNYVQSKDFFKDFIHLVIRNFSQNSSINANITVDNFTIVQKQCAPISIILNELLTNSLKHSNHAKPLTINVEASLENEHILLSYWDTNDNKLPTIKLGMGLELIDLLVIQLKGTMKRNPEEYYRYKFSIPYDKG